MEGWEIKKLGRWEAWRLGQRQWDISTLEIWEVVTLESWDAGGLKPRIGTLGIWHTGRLGL